MKTGTITGLNTREGISKSTGKKWFVYLLNIREDNGESQEYSTFNKKDAEFEIGDIVSFTYDTTDKGDKTYYNLTAITLGKLNTDASKQAILKVDAEEEVVKDTPLSLDSPPQYISDALLFNACFEKAIDLCIIKWQGTSPHTTENIINEEQLKEVVTKLWKMSQQNRFKLIGR